MFFATLLHAFGTSVGDGGFGGDDGGGDGGCCTVPEALESDSKALREDFEKLNFQELLDQQLLETLCMNNACGGLSEAQASRLLDRAIANHHARIAEVDRLEAKWTTRLSLGIAVAGLVVSLWSLSQSNRNVRDIGRLEERTRNSGEA
ncbi:MAG: hypothetical protein AAF198_01045 [Pseudomonadota bacterium]